MWTYIHCAFIVENLIFKRTLIPFIGTSTWAICQEGGWDIPTVNISHLSPLAVLFSKSRFQWPTWWDFQLTGTTFYTSKDLSPGRGDRVNSVSAYCAGGLPFESRQPTSATCKWGTNRLPCCPSRGQQVSHQRWIWGIQHTSEVSTLSLKPRTDVTRSPKQGYQYQKGLVETPK